MASGQRNILLLLQEVYNAITLAFSPGKTALKGTLMLFPHCHLFASNSGVAAIY